MNSYENSYLSELLKSLKGLKRYAEKAFAQISDAEFNFQPDKESNSVAIIIKHISGNMISRFTDFLTTDGEKKWRNRDTEFTADFLSSAELQKKWNDGWECLFNTLSDIKPEDLSQIVSIRNEEQTVLRALQRQLVHYAYHTGQIVYICKLIRSTEFKSLSIPRGQSDNFNNAIAKNNE